MTLRASAGSAAGATPARARGSAFRRAAVLAAMTVTLVVGAALPSWAAFTTTAALPGPTVATATVAPPAAPTARTSCSGSTVSVALNWPASTAPGVTGYRLRMYLNQSYQDGATVSGTSWQGTTDTYWTNGYTVTFTVTALTGYGWTGESPHTVRITC